LIQGERRDRAGREEHQFTPASNRINLRNEKMGMAEQGFSVLVTAERAIILQA
jgi:hypothetical protein